MAQSQSNPAVMYAGTGESFYSVDVINGDGTLTIQPYIKPPMEAAHGGNYTAQPRLPRMGG